MGRHQFELLSRQIWCKRISEQNVRPGLFCCAPRPRPGRSFFAPRAPCAPAPLPTLHVIGGRERAKHIDIRKHFAHEVIQRGEMRLVKIDTSLQLADIFTKPLPYPQFLECLRGILRNRSLGS